MKIAHSAYLIAILASCAACSSSNATSPETKSSKVTVLQNGIYSNAEEVYFDKEEGRSPAPWTSIRVIDGNIEFIDAFQKQVSPPANANIISANSNQVTMRIGKKDSIFKHANGITCWAAVLKDKPKADGSPDWHFQSKLKGHDQGGRIRVGGGDTGAREVILRMRSVYWTQANPNRPTRVLYIHNPDEPARAVSYSWANIDATRVGINLRWVQSSCTVDGLENKSKTTSDSFRG